MGAKIKAFAVFCIAGVVLFAIVQISRAKPMQNRQPVGLSQPFKAGIASWYSNKEHSPRSLMANGEVFDDGQFTCASWDYRFGTRLLISNRNTGAKVVVEVTDRGPAKRLYRMGRIIDLSKAAFARIAPLKQGLAKVQIEVIGGGE